MLCVGGLVLVLRLGVWWRVVVWWYLRAHRLPVNPLYEQGYTSIGCAPCTRPTRPGEDERAGRWWWEAGQERECGLHTRLGGAVSDGDRFSAALDRLRADLHARAREAAGG